MKVYCPKIVEIRLFMMTTVNGYVKNALAVVSNSVVNAWQELTFNLTQNYDYVNSTHTYNSIQIDFGYRVTGDGLMYYFDDLAYA